MHRILFRSFSMSSQLQKFDHLLVTVKPNAVAHVELNRPEKKNALNGKLWSEIGQCFHELGQNPDCRVVVLSAQGSIFTAGIDLQDLAGIAATIQSDEFDTARKAFRVKATVKKYQDSLSSLEKCPKPVIVAVHGLCIGAGTSLISSADIRYATKDSIYSVKEVDVGLAADVGALQRMPKSVGNSSLLREIVYTARNFTAEEALRLGFVSRVFNDRNDMINAALELAALIASKSPVAVQGSKANLIYARDHPVDEALEYMAIWNSAMLQTDDIFKAATAAMTKSKDPVEFSKL